MMLPVQTAEGMRWRSTCSNVECRWTRDRLDGKMYKGIKKKWRKSVDSERTKEIAIVVREMMTEIKIIK